MAANTHETWHSSDMPDLPSERLLDTTIPAGPASDQQGIRQRDVSKCRADGTSDSIRDFRADDTQSHNGNNDTQGMFYTM